MASAVTYGTMSPSADATFRGRKGVEAIDKKAHSFAYRVFTSPTFWAVASAASSLGCTIAGVALLVHSLPLVGATILIGAVALAVISFSVTRANKERLVHDASFMYNRAKIHDVVHEADTVPKKKKVMWANEIPLVGEGKETNGKLFLGSLPLNNKKHPRAFQSLDIKSVVSAVESFEFESSIVGSPLTSEEYSQLGIIQKHIPTADYQPLSSKDLVQGAKEIHEAVSNKRNVYVHCKAGRGRSAMIVAAYFVLHEGMSAKEAISHVKKYRPNISLKIPGEERRARASSAPQLTERQLAKFSLIERLERQRSEGALSLS